MQDDAGTLDMAEEAVAQPGAFMRASNIIYETPEGRPFWKLRPFQILLTFAITLILALVLIALFITGPLAEAIGDELGIGDAARTAFGIAKWPFLFLIVVVGAAAVAVWGTAKVLGVHLSLSSWD